MYVGLMFPGYDHYPLEQLPAHYPSVSWQEIPAAVRSSIVFLAEGRTLGVQSYVTGPLHTALDIKHQEQKGKGVHSLLIDWRQSDASLLHDFQGWLASNRPKKVPVIVHRGRQSLRDSLNALAAMRLRHHYRADEADIITSNAFGRSLYNGTFVWDRAASRGVELFKALFPHAGEPKSAVRKPNVRGRPRPYRVEDMLKFVQDALAENQVFRKKMEEVNAGAAEKPHRKGRLLSKIEIAG